MKILCISDWEAGEFSVPGNLTGIDLVLSLGDVYRPVLEEFAETGLPVLGVHGNHDSVGFPPKVGDIHLEVEEVSGISFGGCEGSWPYKPVGHFLYYDDEIQQMLENFPSVNVFAAHNPPKGATEIEDMVHNGFGAFNRYIEKNSPDYFIHGHIHENREGLIGDTKVISVYGVRELEIDINLTGGRQ